MRALNFLTSHMIIYLNLTDNNHPRQLRPLRPKHFWLNLTSLVHFWTILEQKIILNYYFFFQIRAEVEADKDQEKKRAVNVATRSLERDLERLKADHATEIEQLNEKQKQELIDLKKKPWCYNCKKEAILWCCVFETIDENTGVNSLLDNWMPTRTLAPGA